ncbi:MAG: phage terminase large subunit [Cyanobacteria bacterium J06559_3]
MPEAITLKPQKGPQEKFLSTNADIIIYGGGAGGGKSWSILMEALRHMANPGFNAVFFRRTYPQIKNPGGLWHASTAIYPLVGGQPRQSASKWLFPGGAYAVMRPLKLESNVFDWQGTELVYVAFDELTHFTEFMFWYITSRMRSTCGVTPYLRATCNPTTADDPVGGWVRKMIDWWIGDDGLPIRDRAGIVRHFVRRDGELEWHDQPTEETKSFTFIPATVYDNQALLQKDPNYLKNLMALPLVQREQLLGGNWNIKASSGKVFRVEWFQIIDQVPAGVVKWVRFWDFASSVQKTAGHDPDWTVGILMGIDERTRRVIIKDVRRLRGTPQQVNQAFVNTASQDGRSVSLRWFQDPGQAGQYQTQTMRGLVPGLDAKGVTSQISKGERANPLSRAAEFGEVMLLRAAWNDAFTNELAQFPDGAHDDQVDAAAGAYLELTGEGALRFGTAALQ